MKFIKVSLQYKLEVTVTPKTATLKIDDEAKTLDADGKFTTDVDFDTKLKLVTELDGYEVDTQDVTILAKDNIVNINLSKSKVRQNSKSLFVSSIC